MTDPHACKHQPQLCEAGDPHASTGIALMLLSVSDGSGRPLWKLPEVYRQRIGPTFVIEVPAGYVTNFATVPSFFYRLTHIGSPTELREAALVHDYLCNEDFGNGSLDSGYSRWMADAVLWEVMTKININWFKRACVYAAVRVWAILARKK